jgi:hypothetical protein
VQALRGSGDVAFVDDRQEATEVAQLDGHTRRA